MASKMLSACAANMVLMSGAVRRDFKANKPAVGAWQVLDEASSMIQKANGVPLPKALNEALELVQLDAMREADGATPDADANFDAALNTAIDSIGADVEPKIKQGKASTDTEQDRLMDSFRGSADLAFGKQKDARAKDNLWIDCVGEQQSDLALVEQRRAELATAQAEMKTECDKAESFKAFEEVPQFGELSVDCDVSVSGQCDGQVNSMEQSVDSTISSTNSALTAATKKYDDQYAICVQKTSAKDTAVDNEASATTAFNQKVESCTTMKGTDELAQCDFGLKYSDNCDNLAQVAKFMQDLQGTNNMWSNQDRQKEWKSVRGLKCTLQKVVGGAALDDALVSKCNEDADASFATEVGVVEADTDSLAGITGSTYTCQETEIKFSGFTWDIPEGGDKAQSTDYAKNSYVPAVQRTADGLADPVFVFCQ